MTHSPLTEVPGSQGPRELDQQVLDLGFQSLGSLFQTVNLI